MLKHSKLHGGATVSGLGLLHMLLNSYEACITISIFHPSYCTGSILRIIFLCTIISLHLSDQLKVYHVVRSQ